MLDKKKNSAYIWYSGATDITGIKLAEALEIDHGNKKPDLSKYNYIIGWGTKVKGPVTLDKAVKFLNYPSQILLNRDKFEALKVMGMHGVNIANFVDAATAVIDIDSKKGHVAFPLIGRTKYHQGGKGFWICPTMTHLKAAISEGAKYFQNMIEIKDEYRLHVFKNKVIYAVKKVKRSKEDYQEFFVLHELDRQKKLAEKNDNIFDEETARLVIERMAKKQAADGADMIIRSNKLGWKFSHVKKVDKELEQEAIKAVKALELDFGAVDCCIDVEDTPYIIEINTGPGLEKTSFDAYVEVFKQALTMKKIPVKTHTSTKEELLAKTALIAELVESADESEAAALKSVFKKMFD